MPKHSDDKDLEKGEDAPDEPKQDESDTEHDEYAALLKFVATYRPGKGDHPDDESQQKGTSRWKRLRTKLTDWTKYFKDVEVPEFKVPEEWLTSDIKKGLSDDEVEKRRSKVGWNEISSESQNQLSKFFSYFTGPILYGIVITRMLADLQSWRSHYSLRQVSGIGSTLGSLPGSFYLMLLLDGIRKSRPLTWLPPLKRELL